MKKETIESIHKSIKHWNDDIAYCGKLNIYADSCPLCEQFGEDGECHDEKDNLCPVAKKRGQINCGNTPWVLVREEYIEWLEENNPHKKFPNWWNEIEAQIDFLISLLPAEEQKRYEPEESNHIFRIKFEKIVERGIQKFKVLEITAPSKMELPEEYTENHKEKWTPYAMGHCDNDWLYGNMDRDGRKVDYQATLFQLEKVYSKKYVHLMLAHIERSTKQLRELNSRLEKENAAWNGHYYFKI